MERIRLHFGANLISQLKGGGGKPSGFPAPRFSLKNYPESNPEKGNVDIVIKTKTMKIKQLCILVLLSGILFPLAARAQTNCSAVAEREYRKEYYKNYSRWSVGADAGISAVWGDFRSFAYKKSYVGVAGAINVGYQVTPTFGLTLTGMYTFNRTGAPKHSQNRILGFDGFTWNDPDLLPGHRAYKDLYSDINAWSIGLSGDFNLNNLFAGYNADTGHRRWTFLLGPSVYFQYFRPVTVKIKGTKDRYTTSDLFYSWQPALGGQFTVKYKAGRLIDLELKTRGLWISNSNFDGIHSSYTRKNNMMWTLSLGASFKLGKNSHTDHLLYASTRRNVQLPMESMIRVVTETVEVPVEVPVEKVTIVEVKVESLPCMPTIHFNRGSAVIDEQRFAPELRTILNTLRENKDADVCITGYADHTGTVELNDRLTMERAEALRDYLVRHGIDASRIECLVGAGKDPVLTGADAFSERARRVEVTQAN